MTLPNFAAAVISIFVFTHPYEAQSASFSIDQQTGTLLLEGGITEGDFDRFSKALNENDVSRIALASNGGLLREALQIGEQISLNKLNTEVKSNEVCASACAYIWLSGAIKTINSGGSIGFHSPYKDDGQMSVSSSGNALTGAYLARLGFNDMIIIYATEAAPREMRWLSVEDSNFLGLNVVWDGTNTSSEPGYTLTKDEIEKALISERWAGRLNKEMKPVFRELINIVHENQLDGENWEEAVRSRFLAVIQKYPTKWLNFENNLWATSSVDVIYKSAKNSLKRARILQDKEPKACIVLFDHSKVSNNDLTLLFEADRHIPNEITKESGEIFFEALSQAPQTFKPPNAKQRKAFDKRFEKILLGVFNSYKRKQRKSIEASLNGNDSNPRLLCDFLIKGTEALMRSPDDFIMSVRLDN